MTNEQVTELLRAAQVFWKKHRDNVPKISDMPAWNALIDEANIPLDGLPEYASGIMVFFMNELQARSWAAERRPL